MFNWSVFFLHRNKFFAVHSKYSKNPTVNRRALCDSCCSSELIFRLLYSDSATRVVRLSWFSGYFIQTLRLVLFVWVDLQVTLFRLCDPCCSSELIFRLLYSDFATRVVRLSWFSGYFIQTLRLMLFVWVDFQVTLCRLSRLVLFVWVDSQVTFVRLCDSCCSSELIFRLLCAGSSIQDACEQFVSRVHPFLCKFRPSSNPTNKI